MAETIYSGSQSIFSDVPGFSFLGLMSPKRKSYLEAEAERTLGIVDDVFTNTGTQIDGLDSIAATPEQRQQVQTLRSRLGVLKQMAVSGRPGLAEMAMSEYSKLNDDLDTLGTQFAASGILARQAGTDRARDVIDSSELMREEMYKELDPIRDGLDSFKAIAQVSEINSPFALTAAAYKTVMLLQEGSGSRISDADLKAAQTGITSWAGWLEQQLAAGAGGEGFTAEARNSLLQVLEPLAQIAEDRAASTLARYGAFTDAGHGKYDPEIVFAGLDEGLYRRPPWKPSPVPTEIEVELIEENRAAQIEQTGARTGRAVGGAIRAFASGFIGLDQRREALNELNSGRVMLTPDEQSRIDELGGLEGLREMLEDRRNPPTPFRLGLHPRSGGK